MRGNLKVTSGETDLADKWRTDYYINDPSCQARRLRGALGATPARLGAALSPLSGLAFANTTAEGCHRTAPWAWRACCDNITEYVRNSAKLTLVGNNSP